VASSPDQGPHRRLLCARGSRRSCRGCVRRADANRTHDARRHAGLSRIRPRLDWRKRLPIVIRVAAAIATAGGLSGPSMRATWGGFRAALSFAGLVKKLSQLRGEYWTAIHNGTVIFLTLQLPLHRQWSPIPRTGPIEMRVPAVTRRNPSPGTLPWLDCAPAINGNVASIVPRKLDCTGTMPAQASFSTLMSVYLPAS
jgi:hypothetical protein